MSLENTKDQMILSGSFFAAGLHLPLSGAFTEDTDTGGFSVGIFKTKEKLKDQSFTLKPAER